MVRMSNGAAEDRAIDGLARSKRADDDLMVAILNSDGKFNLDVKSGGAKTVEMLLSLQGLAAYTGAKMDSLCTLCGKLICFRAYMHLRSSSALIIFQVSFIFRPIKECHLIF